MDWYPWYFSLYEQDTMHLNPYQDGCYRRLIDHYMKTRAPLPDNDAALARIVGDSLPNWLAMASLCIRQFFTPKDGLLYLKRCEDVLNYQDKKAKNLSESGKAGAKKRWNKIKNIDSHPIANPLAPPMGSAIAQDRTVQDIKEKNIIKKEKLKPEDVPDSVWEDFKKLRQTKKAPITETALNGIRREADKANIPLTRALEICCERGWTGFKAEWMKNERNKNAKQQLIDEYNELVASFGADADITSPSGFNQ